MKDTTGYLGRCISLCGRINMGRSITYRLAGPLLEFSAVRLTKVGEYTGVEYHRWDICHCARVKGKKLHLPLYQFLKEPLIRRFGQEWYDELELTATEWKKQCAQK